MPPNAPSHGTKSLLAPEQRGVRAIPGNNGHVVPCGRNIDRDLDISGSAADCGHRQHNALTFRRTTDMPLPGTVLRAPAGLQGFDTDTVLSTQAVHDLRTAGFA